jgi:hypothetical protein
VTLPSPSSRKPAQTVAHAVLFTPELLCNVIAQFPLEDIVTATGVCHFWRNAAAAEPKIQKALFLIPEKVSRMLLSRNLVESTHYAWRPVEQIFSEDIPGKPMPKEWCYTIGRLHPFLRRICNNMRFGTREADDIGDYESNIINPGIPPDLFHPNGSWRDIFISQPPCQKVCVTVKPSWSDRFKHGEISTFEEGVRLGDLHDTISLFVANEMECDRPHDQEAIVRMRIGMGFMLQYYSNVDDERPHGTMEVPVRDGIPLCPEKLVWNGTEKK